MGRVAGLELKYPARSKVWILALLVRAPIGDWSVSTNAMYEVFLEKRDIFIGVEDIKRCVNIWFCVAADSILSIGTHFSLESLFFFFVGTA